MTSFKIPLTKGQVTIVDEDVYKELSQFKWHYTVNGYAARRVNNKIAYMHRVITDAPKGKIVDHINQNPLDNRASNLRLCTQGQNLRNRGLQTNNTSGYKGASQYRNNKKWKSYIKFEGKIIGLGTFGTAEEAAEKYNEKALELFGEFACLNEIKYEKDVAI